MFLCKYVKLPSTREDWLKVSDEFSSKWKFPHAIGAIDGKHVPIKAPANSGSDYFNYKQFFSVVLLAIVDANCNFMYADVGCKGRISDSGILRTSRLFGLLERNELNIPEAEVLRDSSSLRIPYMFLGDKAFAFTNYCIRPFGGTTASGSVERVFNDRHSKARRTVEMAFGILSARFRVLRKPMELNPLTASKIVLTTVYLHNFIRRAESTRIHDREPQQGESNFTELRGITQRTTNQLLQIRLHLANGFANGTI
ncbi:putative nuclease HARBI1 [Anopheles funestus]|uniref:putative nuclease HARBI1 n=1 Tax=Anopheles funestus TaxID=62324 RepID=UPI0020C61392|nr:putative nuclease HARBI1 [Anopheles funestus]